MDVVRTAQLKLEKKGIAQPRLEAEMLAGHVLGCSRHELYLTRGLTIDSHQMEIFSNMVEKRCMGEPIQYIIGNREFMGLSFKVDRGVLVPRCDTETLVEVALERLPRDREILVADIGTGSGAIAVSLAYYMPNVTVFAVDIDEKALSVARENSKRHGVDDRVKLVKGDMFGFLGDGSKGIFDAIISNPPYIPTGNIGDLSIQVKDYEPRLALDGGADGLSFYRKIAKEGYIFVRSGGFVALEVGYNQAPLVSNILQKIGHYTDISCVQDLSGIHRVVVAQICHSL